MIIKRNWKNYIVKGKRDYNRKDTKKENCQEMHHILFMPENYRVFIKCCVFPLNAVIFLNSLTPRGNRERSESGICFKIFEKTQYLMNTL